MREEEEEEEEEEDEEEEEEEEAEGGDEKCGASGLASLRSCSNNFISGFRNKSTIGLIC